MPERQIVTNETPFPIQPCNIDAKQHFFDAFDHMESETSAHYVVKLCQHRGGWHPFTSEEINAFYERISQHKNFVFNRLVEPQMVVPNLARAWAGYHDPLVPVGGGWIVLGDDGKYRVTDDFIARCFKSSPVRESVPAA